MYLLGLGLRSMAGVALVVVADAGFLCVLAADDAVDAVTELPARICRFGEPPLSGIIGPTDWERPETESN